MPRKYVPQPKFRSEYLIPKLLEKEISIRNAKSTRTMSSAPLSMLVLESAKNYLADKSSFGKNKRSFDSCMKPFFSKVIVSKQREEALKRGLYVYDRIANKSKFKVGGSKANNYLKKAVGSMSIDNLLGTLHNKGFMIHPDWVKEINAASCKVHIKSNLLQVKCYDPEELQVNETYKVCVKLPIIGKVCTTLRNPLFNLGSGDEIYIVTYGVVLNDNEYLHEERYVSEVTEHIGTKTGHDTTPNLSPASIRTPLDYRLNKTVFGTNVFPSHYVYQTITLFEQEHSDAEKRQAIANAVTSTIDLLADIISNNWIGAVVDLGRILFSLAVALDDDDELGSAADLMQIDCSRYAIFPNQISIEGSHLGNHYKYVVDSNFETSPL